MLYTRKHYAFPLSHPFSHQSVHSMCCPCLLTLTTEWALADGTVNYRMSNLCKLNTCGLMHAWGKQSARCLLGFAPSYTGFNT